MTTRKKYIQLIQDACRKMKMRKANLEALKSMNHDFKSESLNGFCYDATEAALFLFGRNEKLEPVKKGKGPTGHYWLLDESTNTPVDIISLPSDPEYDYSGYKVAHLLKNKIKPGKRAQKIIDMVTDQLKNVAP
jgi:hypothetical protein